MQLQIQSKGKKGAPKDEQLAREEIQHQSDLLKADQRSCEEILRQIQSSIHTSNSSTAGAIGITESAKTSILQLRSLIRGLTKAQDLVTDIASSLARIEGLLAALEQLEISDESISNTAKQLLEQAGVTRSVNECGEACNGFSKNLEKWTKASSKAKLSLRHRLSVGLWNRERTRTLEMQLQSCATTVEFAVTSTQLMVQRRSENTTKNDRTKAREQRRDLKTKIRDHLDLTEQQQQQARERKRALEDEPEDEEDDGAQRTLATKEIEKQSGLLEAARRSYEEILQQIEFKWSVGVISDIHTSKDSNTVVALRQGAHQRITNMSTTGGSTAVVGVYSNNTDLNVWA